MPIASPRNLWMPLLTLLLFACATKQSPSDPRASLAVQDEKSIPTLPQIHVDRSPTPLKFKETLRSSLDEKDPMMWIDLTAKHKSFYQIFTYAPTATDQVIEIHSFPTKMASGDLGIVFPEVFFFDHKLRHMLSAEQVFSGYEKNADGPYLRTAWKLKNMKRNDPAYFIVAAKTDIAGVKTKGASSSGFLFDQSVQFSATGDFEVLQADSFKK